MKKEEKETTIVGYVDETEDDDVLGLIISAEDDDYVVEMNRLGKRLMDEVGSEVEATGVVKRDKEGNKVISITEYEILEDDDDDDDDDYDDDEGDRWIDDDDD